MRIRLLAALACTALLFCLCSCAETGDKTTKTLETETTEKTEEKNNTEIEAGSVTPIFKTAFAKGQTLPENKYMRFGDGILFFSRCEDGYTVGYFDMKNSVMTENILTLSSIDNAVCHRVEGLCGFLIADGKCYIIDASKQGAQGSAVPEGASFTDALFDSSGAIIYEDDSHILTAGVDFSEQYILCDKADLPDFAALIAYDSEQNRIYYARGSMGNYTGYAYFEYGSHDPCGKTDVRFTSFMQADGALMLIDNADDGQRFTRVNTADGSTTVYEPGAATSYYYYSASADAEAIALYLTPDGKLADGYIDIVDMTKGERAKRFEIKSDAFNPGIAMSADGEYVFFGVKESATDTVGATETADDDYTGELTNLILIK